MISSNQYPYSQLLVGQKFTVAISGPHFQVLDAISGAMVATTATIGDDGVAALVKSGSIRCAAMDRSEQYLASCSDDKILKIWQLGDTKLLNQREVPKRPTMLHFTQDGQHIVTSDKFGDLFSYPIIPHNHPPEEPEKPKLIIFGQDNPAGGQLILGHTSLVTCFTMSPDEKYIITADRDEHIRVSMFPRGYIIETFCLGHQHFVSAIHIPPSHPNMLISGGGDSSLKIWDWHIGALGHDIELFEFAHQSIVVRPPNRKTRPRDTGTSEKLSAEQLTEDEQPVEDQMMDVVEQNAPSDPNLVFAVQRIASTHSHLLVSITGSTSLFTVPIPTNPSLSREPLSFDIGKPVLDFAIQGDDTIYVSVDANWGGSFGPGSSPKMIHRLHFENGHLSFAQDDTLCETLNSQGLILASEAELKQLDLYEGLVSLPKVLGDVLEGDLEAGPKKKKKRNTGERNGKKQAAREKTKKALASAATGSSELTEPEAKRQKS